MNEKLLAEIKSPVKYGYSEPYICRNGFFFAQGTTGRILDSIILLYPDNVEYCDDRVMREKNKLIREGKNKTFDEHINFINEYKLDRAVIFAENIEFITRCPTLKHLLIVPSGNLTDGFDYSPLYKMPEIKELICHISYGPKEVFKTEIDCSLLKGLESVRIYGKGYLNYDKVQTLKSLHVSHYNGNDLTQLFTSPILDTLTLIQCKIKTLKGLDISKKTQCVYLYYNRCLEDISALRDVKDTIKALCIENCPKITDFSVLSELDKLEYLELRGKNVLHNLQFIKDMKGLTSFTFDMNVEDGDLTPCLKLSYASCKKWHKHYNLKESDLPDNGGLFGNEDIDEYRRLY